MLNIAYTHASVILVIFHYYMLQNKQFNSHIIQHDVGGCVICIFYKAEYLDKEWSSTTKEVMLFYLIFPIQRTKCCTKFRFINTLMRAKQ